MNFRKRRKTPTVTVGTVKIGSHHPIVIQSMTNTPTEETQRTLHQVLELIKAGSEMVRITINNDDAAKSSIKIIHTLRKKGFSTPIIGDFHYNGHILLEKFPECAHLLSKYRINPGNVGSGKNRNQNFEKIIQIAIKNKKPVRIGVNWGSIDKDLLKGISVKTAQSKSKNMNKSACYQAMVKSALNSARFAEKRGLEKNKIILSVKMSDLQDMVKVNTLLAHKCPYVLHLGLTEAGSGTKGIICSTSALAILLQQGIGDTIRISLTPEPKTPRSLEVQACKDLLQSLGVRYFMPSVTSCPGCGRTDNNFYLQLAQEIKNHIEKNETSWRNKYPGIETLKIAVMGCIVNGPGESAHADMGISLPGKSEKKIAPVYINGKKTVILKGHDIRSKFIKILEQHIKKNFYHEKTRKNSKRNR